MKEEQIEAEGKGEVKNHWPSEWKNKITLAKHTHISTRAQRIECSDIKWEFSESEQSGETKLR